jgi:flagellin
MSVVNTNIKALIAQQSSVKVGRDMATAMERLSTGLKVNKAADDAAGLAIGSHMTAQIRGLNMAVKNANDAVAMLQTAEGSMVEMTNMLQRMRELSVQAASDTNTSEDRQYLNNEFQALKGEFNRIVKNTQWNGMNILDGTFKSNDYVNGLTASGATTSVAGLMNFQVGANAGQIVSHTFGDYHDAEAAAQVGKITFQNNPELSAAGIGPAIMLAGEGNVMRLTITDEVFELQAVASAVTVANGVVTAADAASAFAALINAASAGSTGTGAGSTQTVGGAGATVNAVKNLVAASAATTGGVLELRSTVVGTAFTVSTSLNQDQSVLNYVETQANATRGWGILRDLTIVSQAQAGTAIEGLDQAIKTVNQGRADIGATVSRLTSAIDNMTTASTNLSDSRSRIVDTDYAAESTKLARSQIISQAATAMLAQANAQQQSVLALLQ